MVDLDYIESKGASYFAIIPAIVRYDDELSMGSKLMYGEISALSNARGYCWATNKYFENLYNVSERTISRWISLLAKKGYVTVEIVTGEDGKTVEERRVWIVQKNGGIDKNVYRYSQKCQEGIDKNVYRGIDKNVYENNTSMNNTSNNIYTEDKSSETPAHTSKTRFVKPTVEEIAAYCRERNNNVDAQYFFDYYEGNGWKRGKTPLKDWKATVRTWERNSYSNTGRSTCGNNNPAGFDEMFD